MRITKTEVISVTRTTAILAGALAVAVMVFPPMASAQGPPGGQQGGFGGGPPQGGPGEFQGRGPGGPGGFMPFLNGTISGGDLSNGVIQIQSQFGGNQAIRVTTSTKVFKQVTISAGDLKIGDQVQVQGIPTAITASSITAGQMPDFMPGGGRRFGPGGPGGGVGGQGAGGPGGGLGGDPNLGGRNGGQRGTRADGAQGGSGFGGGPGGPGGAPANASASGKVTSTSPLTISLGNEISIVLKLAPNAKVTKIESVNLQSLKVGDRIMAAGQPGNDGTFTATGIGVNMDMGFGFGPGGPGGFGPGGPGGFPGGRGGFGGGGVGIGGPPGGDPPPPPPPP